MDSRMLDRHLVPPLDDAIRSQIGETKSQGAENEYKIVGSK